MVFIACEWRVCALLVGLSFVALTVSRTDAQLAYGQLKVTSEPSGSAVVVDGEEMRDKDGNPEVTPWGPAELPEGIHVVTLRHPQFPQPRTLNVTIRADRPATPHVRFGSPLPGPGGPAVALPGSSLPAPGGPPLELSPRSAPPSAASPRPGSTPAPPPKPAATTRAGGLQIESVPSGATVFLEGERRGTTPIELQALREGVYTVRLEAAGLPPRTTSIEVVAGRTIATVVPLKREKHSTGSSVFNARTVVAGLVGTGGVLVALIAVAWRRARPGRGTGWRHESNQLLIVGDYVADLNDVIAEGGMATLYRGRRRTGRPEVVAVKIPHLQYQHDPEFIAAFRHEGNFGRMLHNENIIKIHATDTTPGGVTYIVMEYIEGVDLHRLIASGLSIEDAVDIATQVARALDYAHSKQVVHCDVKPGNILVRNGRPPRVVLTDFGIARAAHQTNPSGDVITGTPDYMAPELVMRRPPGASSDLYALGVVLFEMLARRKPFEAPDSDPHKIMDMQLGEKPPLLSSLNPKVPPMLESIVMTLLAKPADNRYPSAEALINDLQSFARTYAAGS